SPHLDRATRLAARAASVAYAICRLQVADRPPSSARRASSHGAALGAGTRCTPGRTERGAARPDEVELAADRPGGASGRRRTTETPGDRLAAGVSAPMTLSR